MNKKIQFLFVFFILIFAGNVIGQKVIKPENIDALNRIAEDYDKYKWVFGIGSGFLAVLGFWGITQFIKLKSEEWIMTKIAKEADLKVEHLKGGIIEFVGNAEQKKKKVLVISSADGQQFNVKRVFDGSGFVYDKDSWKNISMLDNLIIGDVSVVLFNDQIDYPLSDSQIEAVIKKFGSNVGYFYLGDRRVKSDEYRKNYGVDLDFANSSTRLETGLLSLLKIR